MIQCETQPFPRNLVKKLFDIKMNSDNKSTGLEVWVKQRNAPNKQMNMLVVRARRYKRKQM